MNSSLWRRGTDGGAARPSLLYTIDGTTPTAVPPHHTVTAASQRAYFNSRDNFHSNRSRGYDSAWFPSFYSARRPGHLTDPRGLIAPPGRAFFIAAPCGPGTGSRNLPAIRTGRYRAGLISPAMSGSAPDTPFTHSRSRSAALAAVRIGEITVPV
jgi:hypothetical protein